MSELGITPEEVFLWHGYEPAAGRRAFLMPTAPGKSVVVEMSTVTKMATSVMYFDSILGFPRVMHRADWYTLLTGKHLQALREALG